MNRLELIVFNKEPGSSKCATNTQIIYLVFTMSVKFI